MRPTGQQGRSLSPYVILAVVCAGVFVGALDQYVVVTALPSMMTDLEIPFTDLDRAAWIVIGYFLGYTAVMPLMGRLSDVYGHNRIYVISLFIFMLGSIFAALSFDLNWLVGARIVQAVGGGALVAIAIAIVGDTFPAHRRALPLGIVGGVAEVGSVLGPIYGGVISEHLGWRWIFWINLPIGFAVALLVLLLLAPAPRVRAAVDYRGAFLITASLALLTIGLSQQSDESGFLWKLPLLVAISVVFMALFIVRERRAGEPLLELRMFRNSTFSSANTTNLFVGGALVIALVNVPLMSDTVLGTSAFEGGVRLTFLTAMIPVGAVIGGYLCQRIGYRLPTALGLVCSSVGFFFMSGWGMDIANPQMTIHLVVTGLGFGLVIAPITTAVINSVREDQRGTAAALVTVMRMVGMMIGLSALSSWGMTHFHTLTADISLSEMAASPELLKEPALTLFQDFFMTSAVICLIAILPAMLMRRTGGRPKH